jgi:hypothetical protein
MLNFDETFFGDTSCQCSAACILLILTFGLSGSAVAQQNDSNGWWRKAEDKAATIVNHGKTDLYFSGYGYHGRSTYSAERISELNEKMWGAGVGKSLRNTKGDVETLYFLGMNDSHFEPQFIAGYAYQWTWLIGGSSIEVGAGYTAMLVSRQDYFGGIPFPAILPLGSIGPKRAKLMFSYVPRLSADKGNGDVLFVFGRFELE